MRAFLRLLAINAMLCVAGAAAVLALAELWLRLSVPPSSPESIFEYRSDTPRYKVMKPNASVVAWGVELRTNELGFRDRAARVPPKSPDEFRIVVLGDSFTVCAGVPYERIYTSLLEAHLRRSHPRVKVINLAVAGYNVAQYAMVLQEVGLALQPDMVLVGLYPDNDFSTDNYRLNRSIALGRQPEQRPQAWYEKLYVYRAYGPRARARFERLLGYRGERPGTASEESAAGWQKNVAALRAIAGMAQRANLALVVALLPPTWHLEQQRPLFARVEAMCRREDLHCLDLLEPLIARRIDDAALRLNPLDAHPSESYNAVMAESLAPQVRRYLGRAPAGAQ